MADKNFDAGTFLTRVHKNTTYKEFEAGLAKLKASSEKQNELMKNLVKRHFAKFVSAKGNIDAFYQQMRQQNLISSNEYGVMPFVRTLDSMSFTIVECQEIFYNENILTL